MTDIQDISVIGGPGRISVELDFGAQGIRGSQIFAGIGDPNEVEIGQSPILNDLYVDINTKTFYQYQSIFTVQEWTPLFRLESNQIAVSKNIIFEAGVGIFEVDLSEFLSTEIIGDLTSENINFVFSINSAFPIISAVENKALDSSTLSITINASDFFEN